MYAFAPWASHSIFFKIQDGHGMVKECLLCEPFPLCILFRDSLLASLLDGVRASGNRDVCVKMKPTKRGKWYLYSKEKQRKVL